MTATYELAIFDLAGRLVRRQSGVAEPGSVSYVWDGTDAAGQFVSSGVYYYRVRAGALTETRQMLLLK